MKKKLWYKNNDTLTGYMFLTPALLILGLFLFIPTMMTLYYSLTDYYMLTPDLTAFIGLDNFKALLQDKLFLKSIGNIFKFVLFIMPIQVGTALFLALLVNNKARGTIFYKIAFFSPVVMSLVVVSVLWLYLLNPADGLINVIFEAIGFNPQPLLTSPKQAMYVIIMISAWQGQAIRCSSFGGAAKYPSEVYEASKIDGATKWEQFRHITLPMLKPTSLMILTTTLIDAFKLIIQPMVMTQRGPLNSTLTLSTTSIGQVLPIVK